MELIAVQPFVRVDDYLTEEAFAARTRALFEKVHAARASDDALVVFPEMYGTFLGLLDERSRIAGCRTTDEAMTRIALSRLPTVAGGMLRQRTLSLKRGLFLALARRVHRVFFETFSTLAARYKAWVVAGSLLLPRNARDDNTSEMVASGSDIFNTSYTFDPSGQCVGVTRKCNLVPTQEDTLDLAPGHVDDVPVIDTSLGRVATAICYDGFCEPHTEFEPGFVPLVARLDARAVDIVACPSANAWPWDGPWAFNAPSERQLRREQWLSEGLCASLQRCSHVRYGVNPMLLGEIIDNRFDGRSHIFGRREDGTVDILAQSARADMSPEAEEVLVVKMRA